MKGGIAFRNLGLLAARVGKGLTRSGFVCPFCEGGRTGEKSLSITRRDDGTTLFICHRASCGRAGRIHGNGNVSHSAVGEQQVGFVPRVYTGETRQLNHSERELLSSTYGLMYSEVNYHRLSVDINTGRLVVFVLGPKGQVRGRVLMNLPGKTAQPKSLIYKELDEPFNGWFWTDTSEPTKLVVVEDTISALRVARQFPAVALMGTNLSTETMFDLLKVSEHIVLALDRDATQKAIELRDKYKFIAPQMRVAILEKDLKWLPDSQIREKVDI